MLGMLQHFLLYHRLRLHIFLPHVRLFQHFDGAQASRRLLAAEKHLPVTALAQNLEQFKVAQCPLRPIAATASTSPLSRLRRHRRAAVADVHLWRFRLRLLPHGGDRPHPRAPLLLQLDAKHALHLHVRVQASNDERVGPRLLRVDNVAPAHVEIVERGRVRRVGFLLEAEEGSILPEDEVPSPPVLDVLTYNEKANEVLM